MARDFDNVNDSLLAADAFSGLATNPIYTMSMWTFARSTLSDALVALGPNSSTRGAALKTSNISGGTFKLQFTQLVVGGTGNPGQWTTNNAFTLSARNHVAVTYDGTSGSNDPVVYVNGTVEAVTENITPTGTPIASDSIKYGEDLDGSGDYDGILSNGLVDPSIYTAAEINTLKWWGRAKPPMQYLPLYTDKLADEGSAGATFTAAGTTNVEFALPTVRPGSVLMGMGIGW